MKKISKSSALKWTFIAIASAATAHAGAQVTVTVRADLAPLNHTDKTTYGSGFDYFNADMRVMFTDVYGNGTSANAQKSYDMLKSVNLGMYRFPGGDPSFWYRWDKPCGSAVATQGQCAEYMSMADIQNNFVATTSTSKRAPLGAKAMYQINTVQGWLDDSAGKTTWKTSYQKTDWFDTASNTWKSQPNKDPNTGLYAIDDVGLAQIAQVAYNWVKANRALPTAQQAKYWEIGNEDWVRWTPEQYAKIFSVVTKKMIEANGNSIAANGTNAPLYLVAQTTTLARNYAAQPGPSSNLAINQTAGTSFVYKFVNELQRLGFDLKQAYGVAVHPYINGNLSPSIDARTSTMFAKIDSRYGEVPTTMVLLSNVNGMMGTNWKALVTEYNVQELQNDTNGNVIPVENKSHAVILADWSASMLARGVDKVLPHSLGSDPRTALFMYRNINTNGTDNLNAPVMMTTGAAFARVASALQGNLYPVENTAPTVGGIAGLSNYAAVSDDGKTLNILLVNRNLTQPQTVSLKLAGNKTLKLGGYLSRSAFGETNVLSDNNFTGNVNWGTPTSTQYGQTCTIVSGQPRTCAVSGTITVPAGSMVHLQAPLQ